MTVLAERMHQIKPSATLIVDTRAKELKSQGQDVINLGVGEPDFDTPAFIKQAAIEALEKGQTKYTAVDGIPPLKEAIIHKLERDNHLHYAKDQIIVSNGCKQVLYNLTQVILNEGDEAIIPAPYWVSYPDMVKLAGAVPVVIDTDIKHHFKITPEQLKRAITAKTKLIFLNSPSNPSGIAYTADELKALGEVLKKHPNIIIATDDIYEYILWSQPHFVNILNVCPELMEQTVVCNGVSKSHAMTGWRIGFGAGPKAIISGLAKIQSQSTSNPNTIAQYAAVAALNAKKEDFFMPMLKAYKERHDFVNKELNKIKGVQCLESDGAFYLFPDFSKLMQHLKIDNDIALAEMILEKAKIAVVPGTAFGTPGHLRLSVATSLDNLKRAMERLHSLFS